ncbi:MAG: serine/threonine protein phosphatase [Lachnospiraceae bacterium]|nr:serine/threonine protein phosphatase [Lachnospiraceae bacterium]
MKKYLDKLAKVKEYKHAIPLIIYGIIYLAWFGYLERTVTSRYRVIHVALDDHIPFCEIFVVPYLLWFAYVAVVVAYFFLRDKDDYFRTCTFLFTGMTIFLLVSTLWPNGHHLRPYIMPRDNVFTHLVAKLYQADTPTNLWPSIHVYNSLGCHIAVMHSRRLEKYKWIRIGSFILCISIIMSTMFIKQHSAFDVATAFILAAVMYGLVYRSDVLLNFYHSLQKHRKRKPEIG